MKLAEVIEILRCEVVVPEAGPGVLELEVGCGADLMSDVLAFIKPSALLLTGLTNAQAVRTAEIADVKAIVYVRNKQPEEEAIALAREKQIPLLRTKLLMYEACGRLYVRGLPGGSEVLVEREQGGATDSPDKGCDGT